MMPRKNAVKTVEYHSTAWDLLVETGWITWTVSEGLAVMVYAPHGRG